MTNVVNCWHGLCIIVHVANGVYLGLLFKINLLKTGIVTEILLNSNGGKTSKVRDCKKNIDRTPASTYIRVCSYRVTEEGEVIRMIC